MRVTTTVLECDSSKHSGDKTVNDDDPKTQPFGWNLPDGTTAIVCGFDVMENLDTVVSELSFRIHEAMSAIADVEADKLRIALLSHQAELKKRNAKSAPKVGNDNPQSAPPATG